MQEERVPVVACVEELTAVRARPAMRGHRRIGGRLAVGIDVKKARRIGSPQIALFWLGTYGGCPYRKRTSFA